MLKFCKDAWGANKDKLENAIRHDTKMNWLLEHLNYNC